MRPTPLEPQAPPPLSEAAALCRDTLGPPSELELERGLHGFLLRVSPNQARPRRYLRWSLAGLAVVAGIVGILSIRGTPWSAGEPTLAYRVDGGRVLEGGYLRESGQTGMKVRFNEGSTVTLTPGTRGRLQVVDRDTAHVAISQGRGSFQVVHQGQRRWLVDVGPFLVTVTGTVFTVSWDPAREEFDLRLREGSVVVRGPVSAGEIALRAGQRLVANLAKVQTVITEDLPEPAAAPASPTPAPAATLPEPPAPPAPVKASAPSTGPKPVGGPQWSRKLARGQWDRILLEAKRMGIPSALSEASSEDLIALANAARYRHRPELARSALLAERRRFAGSPHALEATYLLGRVEEARDTGTAQAIAWYDDYLARAPNGPLAGEALGRKMTLTEKLKGPVRARPLAEEYLRRFPKGNYAGSARELLAP